MKVSKGDAMNNLEVVESLIKKNNGLILTKEFLEAGISKKTLSEYLQKGYLERVAHGVYLSREAFEDEMYVLQLRSSKAVFSHDTALFYHDLSDRDSLEWVITLPSGYNATRFKEDGVKVYYVKSELLELGLVEFRTVHNRPVRMYNKERTICDMIRNRSSMDINILNEGIKRYIGSKDKNISLLMRYAKFLKVDNIVRQYLEVLM